jgi:hypothetical protein
MTILRRGVTASFFCLLAYGAAAEPNVSISGPSGFVVGDCNNASIALRFTADQTPVAVRTGDILGDDASSRPVGWSIEWDKPSVSDPAVKEYQSTGKLRNGCPAAGAYHAPVRVTSDKGEAAQLTISVTRMLDPVLDAPSAVTLSLDTLPFGIRSSHVKHRAIQLRETSNGAAVTTLVPTGSELKTAGGESTGIMLNPDPRPLKLPPGGADWLVLGLSRVPDPGSYTGRVALHSPALKQNAAIDVTYKIRIAAYFLLIALAVGVGLGWWVNVYLAARAVLDAALLGGLQQSEAIARRATAQRDPRVQQWVLAVAAELEAALRAARTPAEVQAAVTQAQEKAKDIETKASASADALLQGIAAVRGILQPNGQVPDDLVADRLAAVADELERIQRASDSGDVEAAQRRLADFRQSLPRDLVSLLRPWLQDVQSEVDEFGAWATPADEPERTRMALQDALRAAYELVDAAQLVRQSDSLARQLRTWVDLIAPSAMAKVFQGMAVLLRSQSARLPELLRNQRPALAELLEARAGDVLHQGIDGRDPLIKLKALAAIRRQVEADVRAAAVVGNVAVDALLAQGNFAAAVAALVGHPAEAVASPPAAALLKRSANPLPAGTPALALPRLRVPSLMPVNQSTPVTVDWSAGPMPEGEAEWRCQPENAATFDHRTTNGAEITPSRAGMLTMSFRLGATQPVSANSYAGSAIDAPDYGQIAAGEKRAKITTGVAATVITIIAGYEIFIGNWVGTLGDFFSAFLWGFFGQFGLDRIRELTRPITSRALP